MTKCSNSSKWEQLSFNEAVEPVSDGGKRVDQRDYRPSGALPVIDQGESFIGGYTDDLSKSYTGPLPVVVFGDHTRRVKLVNERFAVGAQGVKLLRPREGWDPKFFAYLLPTLPIANRGYSRHYQFVRKLTFRRPDLPEQQRIVAEIEKQFTRLDAGVASLKRVHTALKRYRASVVKAACEGRLVPTEAELARKENRSYESGEQLLQRILKARREKWNGKGKYKEPTAANMNELPSLPEGWEWATLDTIAEIKGGITKDQKRKFTVPTRLVPYLRVANVQRGHLDLSEIKNIEATEDEIRELALEPGDILFNEGGDRDKLGRGWIWSGELPECIHQNHVFRARLPSSALDPKFISWYANSFGQQFFFAEGKHTTNLASISMTRLKRLPIPIPPTAEQRRVVDEVERTFSVMEELETATIADLQRATRLRAAVLQHAFGERYTAL